MAASNCTRNRMGFDSFRGAFSTRKIATPRLTGTEMSRAMTDDTAVPYMKGNAANCSLTGSQTERLRNPKPNFAKGSFELIAISTMIKTARPAIRTAKNPVDHLNNGSPMRGRALRLERARPNGKCGWFGVSEGAEPSPASGCPMVEVTKRIPNAKAQRSAKIAKAASLREAACPGK